MKKNKTILILMTTILSAAILLSGCGKGIGQEEMPTDGKEKEEDNISQVADVLPEEDTFSIMKAFVEKYDVDKSKYTYEIVREEEPVIYEIYNIHIEKEPHEFEYDGVKYVKVSTGEFDAFDWFIHFEDEMYSFTELVEGNYISFEDIKDSIELFKYSNAWPFTSEKESAMRLFSSASSIVNKDKEDSEKLYSLPESSICYYYDLGNYDYDWIMAESNEDEMAFEGLLMAKYSNEEQHQKLLSGIYHRYEIAKEIQKESTVHEGTPIDVVEPLVIELENGIIVSYMHDRAGNEKYEELIEMFDTMQMDINGDSGTDIPNENQENNEPIVDNNEPS